MYVCVYVYIVERRSVAWMKHVNSMRLGGRGGGGANLVNYRITFAFDFGRTSAVANDRSHVR